MQEDPTLANSAAPSRRGLLALAAAGLGPAIGASEASAQATAFELPKASEAVEPFTMSKQEFVLFAYQPAPVPSLELGAVPKVPNMPPAVPPPTFGPVPRTTWPVEL